MARAGKSWRRKVSAPANIYQHRSWTMRASVLRPINELPGGSGATPFRFLSLILLVPVWVSRSSDWLRLSAGFWLVCVSQSLSLSSEEKRTISSVVSRPGLGHPRATRRGSAGVTKNPTQKVTQTVFRKYNQQVTLLCNLHDAMWNNKTFIQFKAALNRMHLK